MDKDIPLHLQEIIYGSSNKATSRQIAKLLGEGKIRKLAPRVYTPNLTDSPDIIIKKNLFNIIGHLFPGILLSHRSALEFKPTAGGNLFLTYSHHRQVELPGVTLSILKGRDPIVGDNPLNKGLYISQPARAFLENFEPSRKPGSDSKTLTIPEIEERLEQIVRVKGEDGLNELRDTARVLAEKLGMEKEFEKLNKLVSALLSTNPSHTLTSPLASARMTGNPYDPSRIPVFEKLFEGLSDTFPDYPEQNTSIQAFRNFAFLKLIFQTILKAQNSSWMKQRKLFKQTPHYLHGMKTLMTY